MASNTSCGVDSTLLAAAPIAVPMQIARPTALISKNRRRCPVKTFGISSFPRISRFALRHFPGLLLNSPQEKSGAEECDHRPSQKNHEIVNIKLRTCAIHIHQPKSTAKMCKWKQLGDVANRLAQLFEWRECS